MIVYGYCRVSTKKQSIERQIRNIKDQYPDAVIVQDEYTGTTMKRPNWDKLYKKIQPGDKIVFDEVSRMSRDSAEGFCVYQELFNKGVSLEFLKEPHINTDIYRSAGDKRIEIQLQSGSKSVDDFGNGMIDLINKLLLDLAKEQIELAFIQAQKEVEYNHRRTREGIATARLNGKQIGQRKGSKLNVKKAAVAKEIIKKHNVDFGGSLTDTETQKLANISRNTFYKYKKELRAITQG